MKCKSTSDGRPCRARAQAGSDFCFFHDSEVSERRRDAQSRGGQGHRRTLVVLPETELDFTSPEEIKPLLALVARRLLGGELDAKTGHAVCHAIDTALRAYLLGDQKAQMDRIERLLEADRNWKPQHSEVADLLRFAPDETIENREKLNQGKTENEVDESPTDSPQNPT